MKRRQERRKGLKSVTRWTREADMAAALDIDYTRRNKKPRPLSDAERDQLDEFIDSIHYSSR